MRPCARVAGQDERLTQFNARLDAARQRVRTEYRDEPGPAGPQRNGVEDSRTTPDAPDESNLRGPEPVDEDRSQDRARTPAEPNRDGTSTTTTSTTVAPRDDQQPPEDGRGGDVRGRSGGDEPPDDGASDEPPPRRGDG